MQTVYRWQCECYSYDKIDYERLLSDSFFVRDGKNRDSAGVLNTTNTFLEKD